ncbi:hypothetical protein C8A01DRAFT_18964, partial [Parachaetomium inaequale]
AMFRPDRPGSTEHVLHRQPKLSSLGRQRELAEGAVGLKETKWSVRSSKNNIIGATMTEVLDDVQGPTRTASSEGLGVARHPSAPQATPHRSECWGGIRSSTCGRQSFEWETETLLDHSSDSPEDMASYPCPFRQRNPARFNVRDHEVCARSPFVSLRGLKHHIITHHGRKSVRHQCRRCNEQFENEIAFERHLRLPRDQMCEVKASPPVDYEEGISGEIASVMAARDPTEETWTWEGIWRLVFPDDDVPEPAHTLGQWKLTILAFQPVTELVEVEQAFDEGQELLKESLREKLQLLLPEAVDSSYLSFLTGQLELVFETHRVNVMKQSLGRGCPTVSGAQPSETQRAEQQSPPRKPNRRSRRSTLLQALQRNSQDTAAGLASRRASRANSAKPASHLFNEQSFWCRTEVQDRLPTNTIPRHFPAERNPTDARDKYNLNMNPRDSRDSGIGMPCDACDLDPDGGRFSPESFKQRVLRQQLMGV